MNDAEQARDADTIQGKITSFLAEALAREGADRCITVQVAYIDQRPEAVVAEQIIRRWDRTDPTVDDLAILPAIVKSIIDVAHLDVQHREAGRHEYILSTRALNGGMSYLRFLGASDGRAAAQEEASPYFRTTVRTIRIKEPIEISITKGPGALLISSKGALDIEITSSVDSSNAPARQHVRQEPPIEAIIAAIQPMLQALFQRMDDVKQGKAASARPEN